MITLDKTTQALLYLMRCALRRTVPQPIPELDYEALYKLTVFHSVVAMVSMTLESAGLLTEQYATPEILKKWKNARINAVRKNVLLDAEREQLLAHLEKEGIWYLPLKGAILKDLYPQMGMRQMADNDIWFNPAYRYSLKAYMMNRGYNVISFDKGNHDVYEKAPVYNFEFHVALFSKPEWVAYYEGIKDRLVKDDKREFCYRFSDEDFYVYLLLHGYKHYMSTGMGIRFLADIYVYLQNKGHQLHWTYIVEETKKVGINEFDIMVRKLCSVVFAEKEGTLTSKEQEVLDKMLGAGTYGNIETYVDNKLEQLQKDGKTITIKTKGKYVLSRLFPDYEFMKLYSTFCEKHPWSIPFFWIYRWLKTAVARPKRVLREFKRVLK